MVVFNGIFFSIKRVVLAERGHKKFLGDPESHSLEFSELSMAGFGGLKVQTWPQESFGATRTSLELTP